MDCKISIKLDLRASSKKTDNTYPVKLLVYSTLTQKKKLYSTGTYLTAPDFSSIFNVEVKKSRSEKKAVEIKTAILTKKEHTEVKIKLNRFESRAHEAAANLETFTFPAFEKKLFRKKDASISIKYHYDIKMAALKNNQQLSTLGNYDLSLKSISNFLKDKGKSKIENLTFYDVTTDFLKKYESYMVDDKYKSHTTVSMYLRALRTIFNDAISESDIKQDIYPFGKQKNKYQIPTSSKVKKALSPIQLSLLYNAAAETTEQEFAKDIWFFSYACSGMNMKDICLLKYEDVKNDNLHYYRAKTLNTKRANLKQINIFLNDFAKGIIEKYGNTDKSGKEYVFPIISKKDTAEQRHKKVKNFTSFVNLHFNKIATKEGFDFQVSTYWARHSFATNAIRKGATMEFISDALNHSNLNVTKGYFAGFEDDTKKDFANDLMNF